MASDETGMHGVQRVDPARSGQRRAACQLPADMRGMVPSPNGKLLAAVGDDSTVRLLQTQFTGDAYTALCADAAPPTSAVWRKYAPGKPFPRVCK
jgi:hypothetical protein